MKLRSFFPNKIIACPDQAGSGKKVNLIKKNMKASDIAIYREQMVPQFSLTNIEGCFLQIAEGGLILFVAAPKLQKEEIEMFNYRTKKMGYITDDNGMFAFIADNILCSELTFYPYPELKDMINRLSASLSVVLIDSAKDKVVSIKELIILETVFHKAIEQWNLSIQNGISHQEYLHWVSRTLYSHSCSYNSKNAENKQIVQELNATEIIIMD